MKDIRVLVVGVGNMGISHARAYQAIDGFAIAGLCSRGIEERQDLREEFPSVALYPDFQAALDALRALTRSST